MKFSLWDLNLFPKHIFRKMLWLVAKSKPDSHYFSLCMTFINTFWRVSLNIEVSLWIIHMALHPPKTKQVVNFWINLSHYRLDYTKCQIVKLNLLSYEHVPWGTDIMKILLETALQANRLKTTHKTSSKYKLYRTVKWKRLQINKTFVQNIIKQHLR